MSDVPARDPIHIQAIVARIDRDIAESRKFAAEQTKLSAEARKLDRDRWLTPSLAIAGLLGGIATVTLTIARALRLVP
jgi:hypothetical protein